MTEKEKFIGFYPGFWFLPLNALHVLNRCLQGQPRRRAYLAKQIRDVRRCREDQRLKKEHILGILNGWAAAITIKDDERKGKNGRDQL
jgi:hypothetical protein